MRPTALGGRTVWRYGTTFEQSLPQLKLAEAQARVSMQASQRLMAVAKVESFDAFARQRSAQVATL